jgi:hypothetical protein
MNSLLSTLPILLPVAYAFAEKQELIILEQGVPLTESELADARLAGVAHPEKIRVLRVESLPQPEIEDAMFIAKRMGLYQVNSAAMAMGYGICIRQGFWDDRTVLVHECVHVSQYEKLGGIRPFLDIYLRECIDPGFPFGRLNQQATLMAREICKTCV